MLRDYVNAINCKPIAYFLVLYVLCNCISCNSSKKPQTFEENIVPFIQNAYSIKDSAGIPVAFRYIDSIASHIPIADMDYYPIYTFKHNCYLNDLQNADSALLYADSMLAVIRRNSDFDWNDYKLVDASFAKADAYYMKGNYKEAYSWYSKNKAKYANSDPCISGSYNFRIAMSLYKEERYKESSQYFISSFSQQQHCDTTLPQLIRMQEILSNTGLCYFNLKMYDSAYYYYNNALNYIKLYSSIYPGKEKQWLGAKAVVYGNTSNKVLPLMIHFL
jgi:tetratricopeptide (TPR) repeat protein